MEKLEMQKKHEDSRKCKSSIIQEFITHSKYTQLLPGTMDPIEQVDSLCSHETNGLLLAMDNILINK